MTILRFVVVVTLSLVLTACAGTDFLFKASPAEPAGFLEHEEEVVEDESGRVPFNRAWCAAGVCDWREYKRIYVAPVDTHHLLKMSWWDSLNVESKERLQEERHAVAEEMRKRFKEAYANDENVRHVVLDGLEPADRTDDTMILELALVELVPTKVFLHAASDVLGLFLPGSGIIGIPGSGSIAIEGRLRNAKTGEIFFKFADREIDKAAPISAADLSWHHHAYLIIDDWTRELVELSDTAPDHPVKEGNVITWRPW